MCRATLHEVKCNAFTLAGINGVFESIVMGNKMQINKYRNLIYFKIQIGDISRHLL